MPPSEAVSGFPTGGSSGAEGGGLPEACIVAQLDGGLLEIRCTRGGCLERSGGRNRPRVLAGMRSRCRGKPGPKAPGGRLAGCARRRPHELQENLNRSWTGWSTRAGMLPEQPRWISCQKRHALRSRAKPRLPPRLVEGVGMGQELLLGLGRGQQTGSVSYPQQKFVGMGRRFTGIEVHVTVRCPCCDAADVDTRHARICPRAGAQVDKHQPPLHAISHTLECLGIPHQVESGKPPTADRSLRMGIVIRRGGLRDAPRNRESRDTNPSYRTSPMQARNRSYTCEEEAPAITDGSADSTSEARKRRHCTTLVRYIHESFDERSQKRNQLRAIKLSAASG